MMSDHSMGDYEHEFHGVNKGGSINQRKSVGDDLVNTLIGNSG